MPSKAYLETIEAIADFAEREKPENLTILQKNGIQDILRADRELLKSQRESVGYTLGLIVLCLTFLWKSPRLALIAVMASLMPIVLSLAVAGFLKIPLNSVTVMVAAIAFGIGIDDNVHFITHWRTAISGGASVRSAIELAFKAKRRSIISSSIMLIGVFTLLCFMNFPPVQHFGFLTALALVFTTLSALFLLPPWLLKMAMESESL